jgi:predicted XRE-type DNA-binding protein
MFKTLKEDERFEISQLGIVRGIKKKNIKSQYIGSTGYYFVSISKNNRSRPFRVHRLLASAFIPNPNNYPEVNHKDGCKTNNSLENLEWVTHRQNMEHAFDTGLANNTGEKNGQSKLSASQVDEIKKHLLRGHLSQYKIAEMFGVSRSCVLGIKLGRLWKHV